MKRLAIRWAAAVGLLLAATAPTARADLVLSIEPVGVTSMGFFHVMLTNTDNMGTRYIEGVNVAVTLGTTVDLGGGNFIGLGTNAATITATLPPQFSLVNTPFAPLFVSNDPVNNFFGFPANPGDPLFPGSAGFINNLGAGEQVFALGAGQTVQVGFVTYNVNVIPNGAIVLPISILPSTTITEATGPGNVGDNTILDPTFPAPNGPLQIGSVFIPEPTSMVAFAGLVGLGAVIARRRRAA